MPDFYTSLTLLTSPAILFFFIAAAAAFSRSDLAIPEPISNGLSLYLIFCIGFKGGVEASAAGLNGDFLAAGAIGIALRGLMPLFAFVILNPVSKFDRPTMCAASRARISSNASNRWVLSLTGTNKCVPARAGVSVPVKSKSRSKPSFC